MDETARRRSNVSQGDADVELVDGALLLAAYDWLPRRFRELYDQCPEPFNAVEWVQTIQYYGEPAAYAMIWQAIRQQYPAWAPIEKRTRAKI